MEFAFSREAASAKREGQPLVALESALLSFGLPYPGNLVTVERMQAVIRLAGAAPAVTAVVGGRPWIGLERADLERLARGGGVRKCSQRDLPIASAMGFDGATTLGATIILAAEAGIRVAATGGIGGVHRGDRFDISADLDALSRTPLAVVCSGAKALLDLPATREALETRGITVIGLGTDEFPAFYSRSSGLPVDFKVETVEEAARVIEARDALDLSSAVLVCVPVPVEAEVPRAEIEAAIEGSLKEAHDRGISGSALTPFLLAAISERTAGRSREANQALLLNNSHVAAALAVALKDTSRRARHSPATFRNGC